MSVVKLTVSGGIRAEGLPREIATAVIRDLTLPNPEYVMRERLEKWLDDTPEKICIVRRDRDGLEIPRGYVDTLLRQLREAGIEYTIEDRRLKLPSLYLEFHGELRSFQQAALASVTKHGSGLVTAPCGSGKTVLGMALIHHWKQPALILVHTRELLRQTCDAVRQWLGVEPGIVGEGVFNPASITVALVQALYARPEYLEELTTRFGLVLLDEAHHLPARTFTEILQAFPAVFRFGLTATPTRRDGLSPFMTAVIGPIRHEITAAHLRDAGLLVTPRIEWVRTDFQVFFGDWCDIISTLTENGARNALALGLIEKALNEGRKIIALSERVGHVKFLAAALEQRRPGTIALVVGNMSQKKREAELERMKNGEAQVLFATKLADEGLDIPDLDTLVLLTPSRDGGRTMQRVGRTLRAVPGKPAPVVYDLVDVNVGLLANQARTRFFECYRHLVPGLRMPEWLDKRRAA